MRSRHPHVPHPPAPRGFTLVEMMGVILVISLLAGVASVAAVKHVKNSRITVTYQNIATLRSGIDLYVMTLGRYPASLEELVIEGDEKWPGPFIQEEELPSDAWAKEFRFEIRGKRHRVTSAGPDGTFGTSDDLWK